MGANFFLLILVADKYADSVIKYRGLRHRIIINVHNIVLGVKSHTNFGCAASLVTDRLADR
jgi:hypothetical protein